MRTEARSPALRFVLGVCMFGLPAINASGCGAEDSAPTTDSGVVYAVDARLDAPPDASRMEASTGSPADVSVTDVTVDAYVDAAVLNDHSLASDSTLSDTSTGGDVLRTVEASLIDTKPLDAAKPEVSQSDGGAPDTGPPPADAPADREAASDATLTTTAAFACIQSCRCQTCLTEMRKEGVSFCGDDPSGTTDPIALCQALVGSVTTGSSLSKAEACLDLLACGAVTGCALPNLSVMDCFVTLPAGGDIADCKRENASPGQCRSQMLLGYPGADLGTVCDGLTDPTYPAGVAAGQLECMANWCSDECFHCNADAGQAGACPPDGGGDR